MDKKQDEYVAQEFNRQAKNYDNSGLVKSYQRRTQDLVIEDMWIEKGMNILDLGCGTGEATLEIALRLEGTGKVIGLDLSEKMIEVAKQKLTKLAFTNVNFIVGRASDLDYDGYFDYVLSTNAFHHFNNKIEVFFKVWKALKYDGIFLVQDICDDFILMRFLDYLGKLGEKAHVGSTTSEGMRDLLISANFSEVEVKILKLSWFWRIMIGKGIKEGC
jgi:ubiquinone/menaquinone biosynthesis C-methylase UbiE